MLYVLTTNQMSQNHLHHNILKQRLTENYYHRVISVGHTDAQKLIKRADLWSTANVPALTLCSPSSTARLPSSAAVTSGDSLHAVSPDDVVIRCWSRSRDVISCITSTETSQCSLYLTMYKLCTKSSHKNCLIITFLRYTSLNTFSILT